MLELSLKKDTGIQWQVQLGSAKDLMALQEIRTDLPFTVAKACVIVN